MMQAMVIDRFGSPDEFHEGEVPMPQPGPRDVLVRTYFAGVNPADWKIREGMLSRIFGSSFPMVLGLDAAGTIEAVGADVTGFAIGDRVVTLSGSGMGHPGTYSTHCVAPAVRVAHLPDHISFAEGAAIPTASASAASSILDVAKVNAGDKVLWNGAAGGVGSFGIPFLRYLGVEVAATCSARNVEYVRALGATRVIDYGRDDIAASVADWAPDGVDAIIDAVGQHSLPATSAGLVRRGGIIVCIQNLITGPEAFEPALANQRDVTVIDNISGAMTDDRTLIQVSAFRAIMAAVGKGEVPIPPIEIVPLRQVGDAHRRLAEGHVRGKIVLEV